MQIKSIYLYILLVGGTGSDTVTGFVFGVLGSTVSVSFECNVKTNKTYKT